MDYAQHRQHKTIGEEMSQSCKGTDAHPKKNRQPPTTRRQALEPRLRGCGKVSREKEIRRQLHIGNMMGHTLSQLFSYRVQQ